MHATHAVLAAMAATTTSRLVAAAALLLAAAAPARAGAAENYTGVWDAYPATMISMCPHIPRNAIDFDKLNGRWYLMEKGGIARPEILCEMDFHVERGVNLVLHTSLRAFEDQNLQNLYNSTWTMSDDNVWRDYEDSNMFMFVGLSTARSLLLVCVVDDYNDTHDGYSFSLSREPNYVRPSVLRDARLPGDVVPTDRTHCPGV